MKREIEDIFSKDKKEKKKAIQKQEIIVDTREKNSLILANLYELKAKIKTKKLEVGDYQIGEVIIERKTKTDFMTSIKSGRLRKQIKSLKQYKKSILILEEDNNHEYINNEILNKTVLSIMTFHQIPIYYTTSEKDTAKKILYLSQKEKTSTKLNTQKRPETKKEQQRFILEAFPGIGSKASEELLKIFKTLKEIFNANSEEVESITNKAVAKSIKELLN